MASQFDFQITAQISQLEALVKVFEKLNAELNTLTNAKYSIDLTIQGQAANQINQISGQLSQLTTGQNKINLQLNKQQISQQVNDIAAELSRTTLTPAFVNRLISVPGGSGTRNFNAANPVGQKQIEKQQQAFELSIKGMNKAISEFEAKKGGLSLKQQEKELRTLEATYSAIIAKLNQLKAISAQLEAKNKIGKGTGSDFVNQPGGINSLIGGINTGLEPASNALAKMRSGFEEVKKSTGEAERQQRKYADGVRDLTNRIEFAVEKLIIYRIAFAAIQKVAEGVTDSIKTFIDIQHELAEIEKVLQPIGNEMERIKETGFAFAKQFGTSVKEVVNSMKLWAQAGLNVEESIAATKATLLGQNSIGLDAVSITDALTAAMFTYGESAKELTGIIDGWMAVQAKYPITAADLVNGLKRVGSAAKEFGVDLNALNGMITAVNLTTRKSGGEIGNSLKTIFARIPREETIKAFQDIGVSMFTVSGQFRDIDDILSDLSRKWSGLDDVQRKNISTLSAGVHRYVDFLALMNNYSTAQQAAIESEGAFGESLRANQIELETTANFLKRFQAEVTQLSEGVGGRLVAALTPLVNILGFFVKIGQNPIFSTLIAGAIAFVTAGIAIVATWTAVKLLLLTVGKVVKPLGLNFVQLAGEVNVSTGAIVTATTAIGTFAAVVKAAQIALGGIVAILGIISIAMALFGKQSKVSAAAFELQVKSASELIDEIKDLYIAEKKAFDFVEEQAKQRNNLIQQLEEEGETSKKGIRIKQDILAIDQALSKVSPILASATIKLKDANILATESQEEFNRAISETLTQQKELLAIRKQEIQSVIAQFSDKSSQEFLQNTIDANRKSSDSVLELIRNFGALTQTANEVKDNFKGLFDGLEITTDSSANILTGEAIFESIKNGVVKTAKDLGPLTAKQFGGLASRAAEEFGKNLKEKLESSIQSSEGFGALPESQKDQVNKGLQLIESRFEQFGTFVSDTYDKLKDKPLEFRLAVNAGVNQLFAESNNTILGFGSIANDAFKVLNDAALEAQKNLNLVNGEGQALIDGIDALVNTGEDAADILPKIFRFKEIEELDKKLNKLNSDFQDFDGGNLKLREQINLWRELSGEVGNFTSENARAARQLFDDQQKILGQIEDSISLTQDNIAALEARNMANQVVADIWEQEGKSVQQLNEETDKEIVKQHELLQLYAERKGVALDILNVLRDGSAFFAIGADKVLQRNLEEMSITVEAINTGIDSYADVMKEVGRTERESNAFRIANLQVLIAELEARKSVVREQREIDDLDKDILKTRKQIANLKFKQSIIDWKEERKEILRFKSALEAGLKSGLGSVLSVLSNENSIRNSLRDQIQEAELDLRKAISEQDQQGIQNARAELKNLNNELGKHKAVLSEIANIFANIFRSFSDNFMSKIVDDLSKDLAGMVKIDISSLDPIKVSGLDFSNTVISAGLTFEEIITRSAGRIKPGVSTDASTDNGRRPTGITPQAGDSNFIGPVKPTVSSANPTKFSKLLSSDIAKGLAAVLSTAIGQAIGNSIGGGGRNASAGSGIGSVLGFALGGTNPLLAMGLSLAGGLVGGLIGGLFDNDEVKPLLVENTEAIRANTQALEELGRTVINAPTRFRLPIFNGGGSSGLNIGQIVINGGNGEQVYQEFTQRLERDYGKEIRNGYTRGRMF